MTVEDFVQMLVLVVCLLAGSVVLPVGMLAGSMTDSADTDTRARRPIIVFEDLAP